MDSTANNCRLLFDVGGTFLKAVVADAAGELIPASEFSCPMPSDGTREEIVGALTASVVRGAAFASAHGLVLNGIGVAFPGPFDFARGIPLMEHKFRSIYGCSLVEVLRGLPETGPDMPIRFMHDVNAALLGEMTRGNARTFGNAALVTLGTGLGFACCLDREVQYSPMGSPRISIFKRPCRDGILEDWVSKRGILRIHAGLTGQSDPNLTVADLARMAFAGDPAGRDIAPTGDAYSFNNFGKGTAAPSRNLDHIFYRNVTMAMSFRTLTDNYGVKYVSDHYPILLTVLF